MNARWAASVSLSVVLHVTILCLATLFWGVKPTVFVSPQSLTVTLRGFPAPKGAPSSDASQNQKSSVIEEAEEAEEAPKEAIPEKSTPKVLETPTPKKSTSKSPAQKKPVQKSLNSKPKEAEPVAESVSVSGASEAAVASKTLGASSGVAGGVSSGVTEDARGAKIVNVSSLSVSRRMKPEYPAIARKRKEEGTVVLLITLDGTNVVGVDVEKSSGFSSLDGAAVAAVKKWRFDNHGKIVARVPVTFQLR
ncbi:hypothetical protein FACS1894187_14010 [Synergistales bacterium]|nr:hypothetical protein FACS1894187_14010 [Synergistales bacterium]